MLMEKKGLHYFFIILYIMHIKNQDIKFQFLRFGETISRCYNPLTCLQGVLLLKKLEPVFENFIDEKWKWFKVYKI